MGEIQCLFDVLWVSISRPLGHKMDVLFHVLDFLKFVTSIWSPNNLIKNMQNYTNYCYGVGRSKKSINYFSMEIQILSSQLIDLSTHKKIEIVAISGLCHALTTDLIKFVIFTVSVFDFNLEPFDIINVRPSATR